MNNKVKNIEENNKTKIINKADLKNMDSIETGIIAKFDTIIDVNSKDLESISSTESTESFEDMQDDEGVGYIYCLYNPVYKMYGDNAYKLGRTNNISKRLIGYITPFLEPSKMVYTRMTSNAKLAEKYVFLTLKKYRMVKNREFFDVDIEIIIECIEKIISDINNGILTNDTIAYKKMQKNKQLFTEVPTIKKLIKNHKFEKNNYNYKFDKNNQPINEIPIVKKSVKDNQFKKNNLKYLKQIYADNFFLEMSCNVLNWINNTYEKTMNDKEFVKLCDVYDKFKDSKYYVSLTKALKLKYNKNYFINEISENIFMSKYVHKRKRIDGIDYCNILINYKLKPELDEDQHIQT